MAEFPMPINTPRLLIRPVMPGDGVDRYEAVQETLESFLPWMGWWAEENATPELAEKDCREAFANFVLRKKCHLHGYDRETGRLIMYIGYGNFNFDNRSFMITYWVRSGEQGKGYATEGTVALSHYAFKALDAGRVEIGHADGNAASQRVIEKAGFILEARIARKEELADGRIVDQLNYVILDQADVPPLEVSWGGMDVNQLALAQS